MKMASTKTTLEILMLILLVCFTKLVSSHDEAKCYIVYTEEPPLGVDPRTHYIRVLTAVFGSEAAAKEALGYTYRYAATGFSANLTPHQVDLLLKQPGIIAAVPDRKYKLEPGNASKISFTQCKST